MSFTIYVKMKKVGKQKSTDLQSVPFVLDRKPQTLRDLLTCLTELSVKQYNERKDTGQILSCLTGQEIADQALRGKISSGLHGGEDASTDEAIENTLQCFEDGIYRVFAGEQELTELSAQIPWTDSPVFTFIRLTMLSGW